MDKLIILIAMMFLVCSVSSQADVVKKVIRVKAKVKNLLTERDWKPWAKGFEREGNYFVCNNGEDASVQRGASQTVVLNQKEPTPIVAVAWSKAEKVGGGHNSDYSLYLDLEYMDGEPLWGQIASFAVGTHGWERREVVVLPDKPVKLVQFHLLLRRHTGKAWFRDPVLYELKTPQGAAVFDGVPVAIQKKLQGGFQIRDVAADSDFFTFKNGEALGLKLKTKKKEKDDVTTIEGKLWDTTGKDRAVTLVYSIPISGNGWRWLKDSRREEETHPPREYINASRFSVGANGLLSRYPFAAIAKGSEGRAIAIDMGKPAFFRVGYSTGTHELYIAYDFGLTPEKNSADFRFCAYRFDPRWGFRSALAMLYKLFPDYFRCRTPEQGLWMPFYKISKVKGWEDFGFKFKEGNNETEWDDAHNIITFRYTEPHTWWMRMPNDMPRTMEAALAEARRLADKGDVRAKAFFTSGYHDERGQFPARLLNTPWCNGAVWSMNSMPGLHGDPIDFKNKWNADLRERLYGAKRKGDLDGEYIDSSEGYVTDVLNFRRDHFAAARAPLTFSLGTRKPAIFRGLIAYEYIREIANDVHAMNKLMMANGTPSRLCWLAPWLEVMGTETNWNRAKTWRPMSDSELLYRRAMCGPKPFCFLMNTVFDDFSHNLVEKYMKRCLAYGMFPGFFSANASTGHYFSRPELYNRDRSLFKKYVPLCKRVAEAGWKPITLAVSSDPKIYVERFGDKYLTLFNDSPKRRTATITLYRRISALSRDLVTGKDVRWSEAKQPHEIAAFQTSITLDGEDVAVIELK